MTIAVLGYGYWGPNLTRNFMACGSRVKTVADLSPQNRARAKMQFPSVLVTADVNDVFADQEIDSVVIALPVRLHYEMALRALQAKKHVLVEKPMADSSGKAQELAALAEKNGLVLMTDHTFLYTGAIKKIKELIDGDALGRLQYFDSVRVNLGLFQQDVNVLWDLAPHDISILCHLVPTEPEGVVATGICHTGSELEDIAYLTLFYPGNFIAHITASWISPVKLRSILVGGDQKMVLYNDIEPTEKVKVYDSGYTFLSSEKTNALRVDYRTGDIFVPKLDTAEALSGLARDFISAVECGTVPVSTAALGISVVRILEAAQQSVKQRGREVLLRTCG